MRPCFQITVRTRNIEMSRASMKDHAFKPDMKEGLYRAIHSRRDIRSQFLPDPIPEEVLARLLLAAHHAPSVGYSQPWDFLMIRDLKTRQAVHTAFLKATEDAAQKFPKEKSDQYRTFKLEGIREAPLNICVTYDHSRSGPVVIGRTAVPVMGPYSCVCAVQNLWLAARAEGLGLGWVSIVYNRDLSAALDLPDHIEPIAYLCIGYVSGFPPEPELETAGWLPRVPLTEIVHDGRFGISCAGNWPELHQALLKEQKGIYSFPNKK